MRSIREFAKKHPVAIYYSLVFAISWGGVLVALGPAVLWGTTELPASQFLPVIYLALAGPSIAGILSTFLVDGWPGIRELVARLLNWRIAARWYAVALLTAPLLMTAILLVLSLISPAFLPGIAITKDKAGLLLAGIPMGLAAGFLEELGWTGFVMPRLRQRYGVLTTGLIMGVLWGAWHFPLFSGSARVSGLSPSFFLAVLLFSWLPAFRVLMVWVYDRTGSLLLVMLMHAPLAAGSLILLPAAISPVHTVVFDLVFGAVLWLAAGAVLAGPARPGSMTARCA